MHIKCLMNILIHYTTVDTFKQDLFHAVSQTSFISDYNNHLCSVLDKHTLHCCCTAPYKEVNAVVQQYRGAVLWAEMGVSAGREAMAQIWAHHPQTNLQLH